MDYYGNAAPPPYNPYNAGPPPPVGFQPPPPQGPYVNSSLSITVATNPPLPFSCPVPRLTDGFVIVVQGIIPHAASRFVIDFVVGQDAGPQSDVALHLNPRFNDNCLIRNSFVKGTWKQEERTGAPLPIYRGQQMECIIMVLKDRFKIALNGAHYCDFVHRMPSDTIAFLRIQEDIGVNLVRIDLPRPIQTPHVQPPAPVPQPPVHHGGHQRPKRPNDVPKPVYNLTIPYHRDIPEGLNQGSQITIKGRVNDGAQGFSVNLCYHNTKSNDIALHFNPRQRENCVVRNSRGSLFWGEEERQQPRFPFNRGHPFELRILCLNDRFKTYVDGEFFVDFKYRMQVERVHHLIIDAEVQLASVDFSI